MDEEAAYVANRLAYLRQNDPSITSFENILQRFDDELLEALRMNEHINHIHLHLHGLAENSNWDSLLRVLATREILVKVELSSFEEDDTCTDRVTRPFLLALQQNPSLQTAGFTCLQLSGESMASFIDSATSLTELSIIGCAMVAPGGALAIAAALQLNTNIRRLELDLEEMYLIPIVSSLASNTSVKTLHVWFESISLNGSLALASLVESSATIERLELHDDGGVQANLFRSIAQSLIQSMSITDVKLEHCRFECQNEVLMLNSILESKSNLQWLSLQHCHADRDVREEFRAAILSLLQPHSSLRSLELINDEQDLSYIGFHTSQHFCQLLTAVESSPLEHLALAIIDSREAFLALIASIPKMHVGTLELMIRHDRFLEDMTRDFIQAIKRNASLRTVVVKTFHIFRDRDWFEDDADKLKLLAYSARNQFLAQWMENPAVVPDVAWSEYLAAVAQTTGPDTVFSIFLSLTPSLWNEEGE
jgi:hypothetical protein